jgi:ribosomal protein S7
MALPKHLIPITVQQLINSLMMNGRNNGKKLMAVRIVQHAFEIIHLVTEQNPIQVLVDAIINTGPREDSTRIGSSGTVRRQAVDVSPLRRVNQAVSLLTIGVSFRFFEVVVGGVWWRWLWVWSVKGEERGVVLSGRLRGWWYQGIWPGYIPTGDDGRMQTGCAAFFAASRACCGRWPWTDRQAGECAKLCQTHV